MSTGRKRSRRFGLLSGAVLATLALTTPAALAVDTPGSIDAASDLPAYKNTALPFEVRAADLVSRMTRAEKIEQFRAERQQNDKTIAPAIERLGVDAYSYWNEALHDIARADEAGRGLNDGGEATEFPTGLGIAASWNPDLVYEMASAASDEARAMNNTASAAVAYISGMNKTGFENKRKPNIGGQIGDANTAVRFLDAGRSEPVLRL